MKAPWELQLLLLGNLLLLDTAMAKPRLTATPPFDTAYCLSWRVAVEANNIHPFRTVPTQCLSYIESYMLGGQYNSDLDMVVDQMFAYLNGIVADDDGKDAWVLDVDDTCISNLPYYREKHYGGFRGEPYDPLGFKSWAERGACPAIPLVLGLYKKLIECGFRVFLLTGRNEEVLGPATAQNLFLQGFVGHERLIMRSPPYVGQSAVLFKTAIREQLATEGYRIRGNVGDQWSDLLGDHNGDRTFKLPNPMYFVP